MCLLSFFKWGSIGYSLGIVQWDFTRWDHPGNPRRVSGSGLVRGRSRRRLFLGADTEESRVVALVF